MKKIRIKPHEVYTENEMPEYFVNNCSGIGNMENNILQFMNNFVIEDYEFAKKYLKEYGISSPINTKHDIKMFILWLMACEISEREEFYFC